jgi:hypothetical protein
MGAGLPTGRPAAEFFPLAFSCCCPKFTWRGIAPSGMLPNFSTGRLPLPERFCETLQVLQKTSGHEKSTCYTLRNLLAK